MKTAISISDTLFREAERLARRLKKSRSRLYGEALAEYLRRHDPEAVTEMLNRVCAQANEPVEPFTGAAARRRLLASDW